MILFVFNPKKFQLQRRINVLPINYQMDKGAVLGATFAKCAVKTSYYPFVLSAVLKTFAAPVRHLQQRVSCVRAQR